MRKIASLIACTAILLVAMPAFAVKPPDVPKGPAPKATGNIWMSGPSQQMDFNAHDYGPESTEDKGTVEYWNYDYAGVLHYTTSVLCATVDGNEARFMFQIPDGWPGLTGIYVVSRVVDGGTPGTDGDTYGHAASWVEATAKDWCESGSGFSPTSYPITSGNLVVHTYD